jgi:acid phosphatase family membrane protein YuiD
MNYLDTVFHNQIFLAGFIAWMIAQLLKIVTHYIQHRELDLTRIVGSGGMPSSHSSLVMGISTGIGIKYGWGSDIYILALVFSVIVMYDASGVRRSVGKQAIILNRIIKNLYQHKKIQEAKLKEFVGHTPKEVFAGALLGIITAHILL